jgi:hypothetical protein
MSDDGQSSQPRGSLDFVEGSILATVIPASTTVKVEELLRRSVERPGEGNASPLSSIVQREHLFFGESYSEIHRS